jgi:diguanylate cyclase (GGDEF)-like protein
MTLYSMQKQAMKRLSQLLVSIALLFFGTFLFAEELPLSLRSARIWDSSTGLPHNTAQSITQTKDGYLWVATWEGLARFNGREWKVFDRNEIPGLSDNGIRLALAASNGDLWVGSARDGLFKYSQGVWTAIPYGGEIGQSQVQALYEDRQNKIWMLTSDKAIFSIAKDGKITRQKLQHLDSGARLLDFSENSKGELFLSSNLGLFKLNSQDTFTQLALPETNNLAVLAMARDRQGHMFFSTRTGIYQEAASGDGFSRIAGTENVAQNITIEDMLVESDGRILLGTQGDGVLCFCEGKLESFNVQNGLINNRVASLYIDREKSVWIGTNLGVTRLHSGNIIKYTKSNGLSDDYVRAVVNDSQRNVTWVATSNGLNRIEKNTIRHFKQSDGLLSNSIYSLLLKANGELWIGTDKEGIAILHNDRIKTIDQSKGLSELQVRALVSDGDTVWAGLSGRTGGGVAVIESGQVKEIFAKSLTIRSLFLDSKSRLWIGATTGIYVYQNKQLQRLQQPGLNLQYAFGFYEDERGVVWVAADNGLYRISDGKAVMIGLTRGLPSVPLLGVIGAKNDIWVCSNQGVIKLNRSDLDAVASGKKNLLAISEANSVTSMFARLQCNGGGNPIMTYQSPFLMFATASGLAMINTTSASTAVEIKDVLFEEWLVDGQPNTLIENTALPAGTKRVEFAYTVPTYVAPEQVLFRVRLNGFEDDWRPFSKSHEATYTNLSPGKYELWVEASSSLAEAKTEAKISKFPFSINAYFWQRPLFWYLLGALGLISIIYLIRHSTKVSRQRAIELEQVVATRTQEIKTYAQKLEVINQERENMLTVMQKQAEGLAKLASEDAMTGLSNRRHFTDAAGELFQDARKHARTLSVAIIDIDKLKTVNDTYGHQQGDEIISTIAQKLKQAARGRDIVARVGGDEFMMAFPGMSADSAIEVCDRLCRDVAALKFAFLAPEHEIGISIGVSDVAHAETLDKLIADADRYLYQAKASGRNRVFGSGKLPN